MTLPFTKAQLKVFIAEAGALVVFINDFVKFDHLTGKPLIFLNFAATVVTAISHTVNKTTAKAQSVPSTSPALVVTPVVATPASTSSIGN